MPKQRITKEMVVQAAFELARSGGMEQVLVKNIARVLDCSVQPIYTYCTNMEGLHQDILNQIKIFVKNYISSHIDKKDFFRSTGYAYIQLAKEEPHIFQMFVLHKRHNITSLNDIYRTEASPDMAGLIASDLHITKEQAQTLHMNMLIYTIGIGTILATTEPGIPTDEITTQLESAYQAFLSQALSQL